MRFFIWYLFVLSLISQSCSYDKNEIVLLKVSELGPARISDSSLVVVFEKELNKKIRIEYTLSEDTALKRLEDGEVDFAIIPNNTESCENKNDLRTVSPLLPRILVILTYNLPQAKNQTVKELFEKNVVIFEEMSRLDSMFFDSFFRSYDITPNQRDSYFAHQLNRTGWNDSSFVYVGLTHLHNPIMKEMLDHGASFFSLDDVTLLGKGSSVEGLKLSFPKLYPFILPKSFYKGRPLKPVVTIAIPDVLVTCRKTENYLVYKIVKILDEKKAELITEDNIYTLLNGQQEMRNIMYSFPLHRGALNYLNRNKPSVWTRYASVIWPFISILAIIAGAFASLKRHISQRKKIRMDSLYTELLQIRKRAIEHKDEGHVKQFLAELGDIRIKAFDALMENKLNADESFTIFLSLYSDVENEINGLNVKNR
ncbi:MAG: hypothetical protein GXO47_05140 [Chlorobi bacterium]|nr:hypothetical protein [Chlorobiota bacterium]